MRENGIDIQIIDCLPAEEMKSNSVLSTSQKDGPIIGQPLHGSLHNVFERTVSFAEAFLPDEVCLEEMMPQRDVFVCTLKMLQFCSICPKPTV